MERPTVRRTLDLDCSPADLWRLLTDPAELGAWLGRDASVELQVGGRGRLLDDEGVVRTMAIRELRLGEHLAFTWWPADDESSASDVSFTIEETGAGSRLVVTETLAAGSLAGAARASASVVSDAASSWDIRLISLWLSVCAQARV